MLLTIILKTPCIPNQMEYARENMLVEGAKNFMKLYLKLMWMNAWSIALKQFHTFLFKGNPHCTTCQHITKNEMANHITTTKWSRNQSSSDSTRGGGPVRTLAAAAPRQRPEGRPVDSIMKLSSSILEHKNNKAKGKHQ